MLRKPQQKPGYKSRRHMLTTRLTQQSHDGQFLTPSNFHKCSRPPRIFAQPSITFLIILPGHLYFYREHYDVQYLVLTLKSFTLLSSTLFFTSPLDTLSCYLSKPFFSVALSSFSLLDHPPNHVLIIHHYQP
jgi:hypothetical protein